MSMRVRVRMRMNSWRRERDLLAMGFDNQRNTGGYDKSEVYLEEAMLPLRNRSFL